MLSGMTTEPEDPLDRITVSPRRFAAVLAALALLAGLALALVPVDVAAPDPATATQVSCGNAIGGVEAAALVDGLGEDYRPTTVAYVAMCEEALDHRGMVAALLFFGGLATAVGLGVVRRR